MSDTFEDGYKAGYREAEKWSLTLNRYQRDNLLQALNLIGYPCDGEGKSRSVEPFNILNSGDWVGEIAWMLAATGTPAQFQITAEYTGTPNQSRKEAAKRVRQWFNAQVADRVAATTTPPDKRPLSERDLEPQPTEGPDYHADHAAWEERQK
jgi:hypothetical protein